MDFSLSEEQELLQKSAREFLAAECPTDFVREMMRSADGFSRSFHERIAQLGWTGLVVPEKYGGMGLTLLDLALLAEEMGRVVMPGPFFSSSVLATLALHDGSSAKLKKEWLPRLAAGDAVGSLALLEDSDRLDAEGIKLRCTKTSRGFKLDGKKMFVTDAHIADFLIVAARGRGRGEAAVCLLVVPRDLPGVTITQLRSIDQTRRPCEVVFRGVDLPRHASLAEEGKGWKVLQRLLDAAAVILSADCLGGAQRSLEMAVDYSKVREQFGRPIGSFQAVKHIAAEMVSEIEPARSLVWYAAYAYTAEPGRAAVAASMAKARLSDVYARSANRAVQVHGGIGFTWEHDMHLWFKRAKWNESAFGDATYHRERVAKLADF